MKLAPGGKTRAEQQAARQQSGQERIERVNQHVVLVKEGGEEAETDMELQTKEVEELGHCDMSRGTKRALLGGRRLQRLHDPNPARPTLGASRRRLDSEGLARHLAAP